VTATTPKLTEKDVLDLLQRKYTSDGNGGAAEYAYMTHVRNAAGFDATRTIDAVVVSLWKSRGMAIEGFEVKVDRRDWLRELRDPRKMDDVASLVDRFTLVAPVGVVKDVHEVPETWGYIEVSATGKTSRRVREAPLLHGEIGKTVSRSVLVSMLRAAGVKAVRSDLPGCASITDHEASIDRAKAEQREADAEALALERRHHQETLDELRAIKTALGESWYTGSPDKRAELCGRIKRVRDSELAEHHARVQLERLHASASAMTSELARAVAACRAEGEPVG
jgi:hypothetical protein